jgi:CubicO group peptidase (beta-lactamase class C family)
MEDFERSRQREYSDPDRSIWPAYHMYFSTRDMARIGYLMLRGGDWNGRQVIPPDWAKRIVTLATPLGEMHPPSRRSHAKSSQWGYGTMWWVWDDQHGQGPFAGAYTAIGAGGQYITVLPALDVVVAHKTIANETTEEEGALGLDQYMAILMHVVAAHCGDCDR